METRADMEGAHPAALDDPVAAAADQDVRGAPTLTFLFTDIEGSTRLEQRLGTSQYAAVRERHRELLRSSAGSSTVPGSVPIPLLLRAPVALVVIAWAAIRGWRWLLPVGVLLAMPVIWWGSLSLLAACVALRRLDIEPRVSSTLSFLEGRYGRRVAPAS